MQLKLDTPIKRVTGEDFSDKPTMRTVCLLALTTPIPSDEQLPLGKKMELYRLAQRFGSTDGIIALTAEDVVVLKERIGKVFKPVEIIGFACDLLEAV